MQRPRHRLLLTLLSLPVLGLGCTSSPDPALSSATAFTKAFYGWYVPKADKGMGEQLAIGDSAGLFDSTLVAALRADAEAQAKDSDAVVGLDGDPFLNAQDFCQSYEVGSARHDPAHVLVEVYGVCDGKKHATPDVLAELAPRGASWIFVDFRYPAAHSSLSRTLVALRDSREHAKKR